VDLNTINKNTKNQLNVFMVIKLCDIFNADTRGVIHTRDHGYYAQMDRNTMVLYFEHLFYFIFFCFEND